MSKEEHFANIAPENAVALECKLAGAMARLEFQGKELEFISNEMTEIEEDVFQLEQMLDHFMRDGDAEALRRAYRNHLDGKEKTDA